MLGDGTNTVDRLSESLFPVSNHDSESRATVLQRSTRPRATPLVLRAAFCQEWVATPQQNLGRLGIHDRRWQTSRTPPGPIRPGSPRSRLWISASKFA